MDDFVFTATILSIGKLAIAIGFLGLFAWGMETVTDLDVKDAIDDLQKAAKQGNAMPLAIFLSAVVVTIGGVLQRFQ